MTMFRVFFRLLAATWWITLIFIALVSLAAEAGRSGASQWAFWSVAGPSMAALIYLGADGFDILSRKIDAIGREPGEPR